MERKYHEKTIKKQILRVQVHFRKDLVRKKPKNSEQKLTFFKTLTFLKTTSFLRH